jgi:probable rRNA maturation factor
MSDPEPSCPILFRGVPSRVRRTPLKHFAARLHREVARGELFECLVADDRELRLLNARFRGQRYPTDVLSFPAADTGGHLGEIAISWQRAREQAAERGHSTEDEIKVLMLHGLLHLLGYDHEDDDGRMARSERLWRRRFKLPAGLIERNPA